MARRRNSRRPSQRQHFLSTPKGRALYFYVKNGASFLIPFVICTNVADYSKGLAFILFLPLVFIFYKYISHYIAMIVTFLETFLGSGKL